MPNYYSKVTYSQFGEDILIGSILHKLKFKGKGFFIDVGAYHPYKFSNTYKFYLDGWSGINIDPTPYKTTLFDFFRSRDIKFKFWSF
ncbi:hypothetical protein MTP04_09450 [Lysinibacillus sp. PLM2]|nr:hypothetical protein MTP04_09450 [Lysinibacillus sp. PLM2]